MKHAGAFVAAGLMLSMTVLSESATAQAGLQVVVETADAAITPDGPRFQITLRNIGIVPLLLNGGEMLGNGQQVWNAVTCDLRSRDGAVIPLRLHWRVPGVAGRLYFLGVPLRPGDAHSLAITPSDYFVQTPVPPGRHELRCTFTGEQSSVRDAMQLPACWEGAVTSEPVIVQIAAPRRL